MDDFQLLTTYARDGENAAFAELVNRHIDVVYGACLRRLRDPAAADDATQAVFLTLARRAGSLRKETSIGGWLYLAAVHEASRSARASATRRRHEMAAAGQRSESVESKAADAGESDISDEIDRALGRLGSRERIAIVLRYLHGRTLDEIAREMRITQEAARKRISRGLETLRLLLRPADAQSRDSQVTAVERALNAAVCAAPASARAATLKAVSAVPAGTTAAISGTSILKGAMTTMSLTKTTMVVAALVAVVLIGAGTAAYWPFKLVVNQAVPQSPVSQAVVTSVSTDADQDWHERFNAVYALGPDEVLKQVPLPLIPEREQFIADAQNSLGGVLGGYRLSKETRMTMDWDGTAAHWSSLSLSEATVASVLQMCVQLTGPEIDRDSIPMSLRLPGDWVWRRGATAQQKMDALAVVVSSHIGRQIRFEKQSALRDAIVARGRYHFTPLANHPNDGVVELASNPADGSRFPPRRMPLRQLLDRISEVTDRKVIDETDTRGLSLSVRDPVLVDDADAITATVARQTGLTFSREKRPVEAWCMVDSDGHLTTPVPPEFAQQYLPRQGEVIRRVLPPYMPQRQIFWEVTGTDHDAAETAPAVMLLKAQGTRISYRSSAQTGTLKMLLTLGFDMDWRSFDDGGSIPWETPIPGDVIVRNDATEAQRMAATGSLLTNLLGRPVHFQRRSIACDVIIASGSAQTPAGGKKPVLFTDAGANQPRSPIIHIPSPRFMKENLPALLNCRVIDQTTGPSVDVAWQAAFNGPVLRDPALRQLTEQTGLVFTQQRQNIDLWTLVDGE